MALLMKVTMQLQNIEEKSRGQSQSLAQRRFSLNSIGLSLRSLMKCLESTLDSSLAKVVLRLMRLVALGISLDPLYTRQQPSLERCENRKKKSSYMSSTLLLSTYRSEISSKKLSSVS